ncbi:MAG: ABC transporter ATP-binding protein [Planctomycetes bacterium]|nr:ABC transporter ATP-binding protein [Planctomycetota bacterium]
MMIQLENVSKVYRHGAEAFHALADINLSVEEGEFLTITGSSGSGKTTLLNIIGALDRPTDGTVAVDGFSLSEASDRKLSDFRSQTIGFIFQAYHLDPVQSALENVAVSLLFQDVRRRERWSVSREGLKVVGLEGQAAQSAGALSAGQKRRLTIARALVKRPKIILADEPTANLDRKNVDDVLALLKRANKEDGVTVVLVSHEEASHEMADRTIRLEHSTIVEE